eukprot:9502544-Pyramimonas_sp.AAC.1
MWLRSCKGLASKMAQDDRLRSLGGYRLLSSSWRPHSDCCTSISIRRRSKCLISLMWRRKGWRRRRRRRNNHPEAQV